MTQSDTAENSRNRPVIVVDCFESTYQPTGRRFAGSADAGFWHLVVLESTARIDRLQPPAACGAHAVALQARLLTLEAPDVGRLAFLLGDGHAINVLLRSTHSAACSWCARMFLDVLRPLPVST
jgi:hypothetical protein